jgi:hypothetical protein
VKTSELELDEAAVEERKYEEFGEFDVLLEESEYLDTLFAEMSALECTYNGCTEYLKFHREDAHCPSGINMSYLPMKQIAPN